MVGTRTGEVKGWWDQGVEVVGVGVGGGQGVEDGKVGSGGGSRG